MTPSIGTPIPVKYLIEGLFAQKNGEARERMLTLSGKNYCCFVNSGTTAFYLSLLAIQQGDSRTEIILPAYTAPSLILPIKAAGLTPVLCDISLKTFNMDAAVIESCITKKTLAILAVHSFGIPMDMAALRRVASEHSLFLIEDAASSFGSKIDGCYTGSLGDIGFFSFNRGKNITAFSGGCLVLNRQKWFSFISKKVEELADLSLQQRLMLFAKTGGYTLAIRPTIYSFLEPIIRKFKYQHLHTSFDSYRYPRFQSNLAARVLDDEARISRKRSDNGTFLYKKLRNVSSINLPEILSGSQVAYNQFPLYFEHREKRDIIHQRLLNRGIEATILYPDPIHRIDDPHYRLNYPLDPDPFPNATYFSKRLLLIPTHPLVKQADLEKTVKIIKQGA